MKNKNAAGGPSPEGRGVAFENYRGDELLAGVARLLILPRYAARLLLLPVSLAGIPVLVGGLYLVARGRTWDALWFLIIGAILALMNGLLIGGIYLLRILADDLKRLTALSSRVSLQILSDVRNRAQDYGGAGLPRLAEIARGSILMVVLPAVVRVIKGRLPLLGGLISILTAATLKRLAGTAARQLATREAKPASAGPASIDQSGLQQYFESGRQSLNQLLSSAGATVEAGLRKASFPLKLLLAILLPLSILVLVNMLIHGV